MYLALEKLDRTTLQDSNALAITLQGALHASGDDTSLVAAAAWNEQQDLVALVCYEEPGAPQFYMLDCQNGELTRLDSSQLSDCQMIEAIRFSACQTRLDLDLACTGQPRSVAYDLHKREVQWS